MKQLNMLAEKSTISKIAGMIVLFMAYFVAAQFGLAIHPVNHFVTLIWPPSGIAVAALTLYGLEFWPAVFIAAFLVNATTGAPVPVALGMGAGNMLEAVSAAYLLRYVFEFRPMFSRMRDSFAFIVVCFSVSLIAATIGSVSLLLGGSIGASQFYDSWLLWWVGDSLGMLIFGPFLIRWLHRIVFIKTLQEIFEGVLLYATLITVSILIFWSSFEQLGNIPLVYILFIPLIWAALRAGPRGMTLALLLTSLIALSGAIYGHSVIGTLPGIEGLLQLQILLGALSIIFLIFVSIVEERKEAIVSLRDHIGKLENALQKIQRQDEAKTEFIATLAHELRNPLSPIVSAVELIDRQVVKPEELPPLLRTIQSHVQTIARLLDDLLDITRITRNKLKLQMSTVELQSIINHSSETVSSFYKSHKHTLDITMPKDPIWVSVDPVRLEQIFVNLLFNAGKYTPPGGKIEIACESTERSVQIRVKDNGIGIAPAMIKEIFEPFVQAKSLIDRQGTGLGIGLSLTKRLVELHAGTIWARSDGAGAGSEFVVELPAPAKMPQTAQQDNRIYLRRAVDLKKHKILVVDDNEAAAQGLGSLLKHSGHDVQLAYTGQNALEKVKQFDPRVVLLDIGLPGMDGYEVARKMKEEKNGEVVLIALTGYGQHDDKLKAKEAGFSHHLTKPVGIRDIEDLLGTISPQPIPA